MFTNRVIIDKSGVICDESKSLGTGSQNSQIANNADTGTNRYSHDHCDRFSLFLTVHFLSLFSICSGSDANALPK